MSDHDHGAAPVPTTEHDPAEREAAALERDAALAVEDDRPATAATQGALPLAVSTGDATVDRTLAALAEVDRLPLEEHAEVFTRVHRGLQDALVDLDRG